TGYQQQRDLHRPLDTAHKPLEIPESGILMTDYLGKLLGINAGDKIVIEILSGRRTIETVEVAGLVSQYFGTGVYMDIYALNRLMRVGDSISGVYLKIDNEYEPQLYEKLKNMPRVASFESQYNIIRSFKETTAETVYIFVGF